MRPSRRPGGELELETDRGERFRLSLVGPSFAGWVYRSAPEACFRLLSIPDGRSDQAASDTAPLARRQEILDCVGVPRPEGVAPIADAGTAWLLDPAAQLPGDGAAPIAGAAQASEAGNPCFYIRYDAAPARHLAEVLAAPDTLARLAAVVATVKAFPAWSARLYNGLMPLPADVGFAADGTPVLLGLPFWRWPDLGAVLADRIRALYLPPELLRGTPTTAEGLDLYVLGVTLHLCFNRPPESDRPERVLARVANGTALAEPHLLGELPYWMSRLEAAKQVLAVARRLTDADPARRHAAPLDQIAHRLAGWTAQLEPTAAVRHLIDYGRPTDAYSLAQDILLSRPSYDLLLVAAEVASGYLRRPLEAIDLYEKAIGLDPSAPAAYAGQFVAIQQWLEHTTSGPDPDTRRSQFGEKIRRNFARMDLPNQGQHAESLARYLVDSGEYAEAIQFIYPWIAHEDSFSPEIFGLNVLYARALGGLRQADEARRQLDRSRQLLDQARAELREADVALFEMSLFLAEAEWNSPRPGSPAVGKAGAS
jgi:tetratricopeptide (TPR) repeat protein